MGRKARLEDALSIISPGACNPAAVAGTISRHMSDMMQDGASTDDLSRDSALRLMAHQLSSLLGVGELGVFEYDSLQKACEAELEHLRLFSDAEWGRITEAYDGKTDLGTMTSLSQGIGDERADLLAAFIFYELMAYESKGRCLEILRQAHGALEAVINEIHEMIEEE